MNNIEIEIPKYKPDNHNQHIQNFEKTESLPAKVPEVLMISSFPPRECGIATYTQDLVKSLDAKFSHSFKLSICALESATEKYIYPKNVKYVLDTTNPIDFIKLSNKINENDDIQLVVIQHEFGFFEKTGGNFIQMLKNITKPKIVVFHTVLPKPTFLIKAKVQSIASYTQSIVVMTNTSAKILVEDYDINPKKITVIPHGTHLVLHIDKELLKIKFNLGGKLILSTFGLLSSGKSIETTLNALPSIVKKHPNVLFLVIGKTHPTVVVQEGEVYRQQLKKLVNDLKLGHHVKFINQFLPLEDLLELLQLTDIYLFTSKDPNQAVSGTFSYAISCGCPIISTPIPHAKEVLQPEMGVIVDFNNSSQLADAINALLSDEPLRKKISSNSLQKISSTAWENASISHAVLFESLLKKTYPLQFNIPEINLTHFKKLTTDFGMIQFSKINQPDFETGYTLDDNARALIAICQHFCMTNDEKDLEYIRIYSEFIWFCQQKDGRFLNYVDFDKNFTNQNYETNLDDSNGRAIWALGYLLSLKHLLPPEICLNAELTLRKALDAGMSVNSTRAMSFIIKGIYYSNLGDFSQQNVEAISILANRLVQMYRHEADGSWQWFESYLTYGNSVIPDALLCAWSVTNEPIYKTIAKSSFDFLLSKTFIDNKIRIISNKNWLKKGEVLNLKMKGGEQPIDIAYTVLALIRFAKYFPNEDYILKMTPCFNWFLGANHLNQIVYNPCTGGCYDGIEEQNVNLNQGAESTISYLLARLAIEQNNEHFPVKAKIEANLELA
ncbi:MAG: glycosyltransferase [Spirosomataceae bacterium]